MIQRELAWVIKNWVEKDPDNIEGSISTKGDGWTHIASTVSTKGVI